jgi:hypothetical protein
VALIISRYTVAIMSLGILSYPLLIVTHLVTVWCVYKWCLRAIITDYFKWQVDQPCPGHVVVIFDRVAPVNYVHADGSKPTIFFVDGDNISVHYPRSLKATDHANPSVSLEINSISLSDESKLAVDVATQTLQVNDDAGSATQAVSVKQ